VNPHELVTLPDPSVVDGKLLKVGGSTETLRVAFVVLGEGVDLFVQVVNVLIHLCPWGLAKPGLSSDTLFNLNHISHKVW